MTEETSAKLPIEIDAGAAGPHANEAFALLGNDTRLAILLALWERYDPHAATNTVRFSDLFDRVAYDDPGSFRYHLQQLEGHFIRQRCTGEYELRVAGLRFIQAVIAGAGVRDATLEPTSIDQRCPFCDSITELLYRDGLVIHRCTSCSGVVDDDLPGFLSAVPFDPAGLSDRSTEEVRAASRLAAWRQTQIMFDGLCPACSSPVEAWLDACHDHEEDGICRNCGRRFAVLTRFECLTCKNHNVSTPHALAMFHPAIIAFYEHRGINLDLRADDPEAVSLVFDRMATHEVDLIGEEPPRAEVVATAGPDEIRLTFDERVQIVDVTR